MTQITTVSKPESDHPWASWIVSPEGIIHSQDGPALEAFGIAPRQHQGVNYFDEFPESADVVRRALGGETVTVCSTFKTNTGTHTAVSVFIPHVAGAMGVCTLLETAKDSRPQRTYLLAHVAADHETVTPIGRFAESEIDRRTKQYPDGSKDIALPRTHPLSREFP